jgi:hypothetical protein
MGRNAECDMIKVKSIGQAGSAVGVGCMMPFASARGFQPHGWGEWRWTYGTEIYREREETFMEQMQCKKQYDSYN